MIENRLRQRHTLDPNPGFGTGFNGQLGLHKRKLHAASLGSSREIHIAANSGQEALTALITKAGGEITALCAGRRGA